MGKKLFKKMAPILQTYVTPRESKSGKRIGIRKKIAKCLNAESAQKRSVFYKYKKQKEKNL